MSTRQIVSPPHTCVRTLPKNLQLCDIEMFSGWQKADIPATLIEILTDVEAFGRGPLRHRGRYVTESFVTPEHEATWYRERGHWRAAAERVFHLRTTLDQPALWITDNWSCGYFHWMCDALARLEMTSMKRDLSELTLLLPHKFKRHSYIRESLAPFGLREIRFLNRFERVHCRELVLPSHVAITGNYNHEVIERMHSRYTEFLSRDASGLADAASPFGERVYISRKVATRRRVENEEAILPVLAEYGFQVLTAEEHDWETQIRIVADAKYLVSNHGAGLTNMLMMASGGRVLEIRDAVDLTPNCYFSLASAAQLDYYYLLAERADPRQSVHSGNMVVDPDALSIVLSQMV